jgi:hypothetical protein
MMNFTARVARLATASSSSGEETPVAYLHTVRDAAGGSVAQVVCVDMEDVELREGDSVMIQAVPTLYTISTYGRGARPDEKAERLCDVRILKDAEVRQIM